MSFSRIDHAVQGVLRRRGQLVAQVVEELGVTHDRGERRTELVVDRVDQPVAQLLLLVHGGALGGDVLDQHDRALDGAVVVAQRGRVAAEERQGAVPQPGRDDRVPHQLARPGPRQWHVLEGEPRDAVLGVQVEPLDELRLVQGLGTQPEEGLERRAEERHPSAGVGGGDPDGGLVQQGLELQGLQVRIH